jgi:hypothetical protein
LALLAVAPLAIASDRRIKPSSAADFDTVARIHEKSGGIFESVAGPFANKGVSCLKECRKSASRGRDGSGICPSFCGEAGSCCKFGHGLEDESCEYGKSGTSDDFTCVRKRAPLSDERFQKRLIRNKADAAVEGSTKTSIFEAPSSVRPTKEPKIWIPRPAGKPGRALIQTSVDGAIPPDIAAAGLFNASADLGKIEFAMTTILTPTHTPWRKREVISAPKVLPSTPTWWA